MKEQYREEYSDHDHHEEIQHSGRRRQVGALWTWIQTLALPPAMCVTLASHPSSWTSVSLSEKIGAYYTCVGRTVCLHRLTMGCLGVCAGLMKVC